jgi:hypothetical protein
MAFENVPLREYFCLRDRESFSIDPWRDSKVYFGDQQLAERITRRIESDFVQPRGVPKFFITGSFGSGKTHTLAHIQFQLTTKFGEMYPTEPIYLDIAPLTSRERYERIHGRLMDAIGLNRARLAVESVADAMSEVDKVEGFLQSGVLPFGDEALRSSQANVFRNLLFGGRQMQLSWEWMRGRKTTVDEAQMLGTQKHLAEPQDFVNCLLNLGALHVKGTGKRIVFLVDEAEAIRRVTNPDSQAELIHAVRILLENTNSFIGFVFAIQAEAGMEDIGEFFEAPDIMRRVDFAQGYIDLNGLVLRVEDVEDFIRQTLAYLVDQRKAEGIIAAESLDTSADLFPFTNDGLKSISTHISDNPSRALPAAIISWMSNAAIEAWRRRLDLDRHQLVEESIVEETIFPEG